MEENIMKTFCHTCLSTKHKSLKPITTEELLVFNRISVKDCDRNETYLCVFCRQVFKKIHKFIEQCELAEQLLNNLKKDESVQLKSLYNLSTSPVEVSYFEGNQMPIKEEDDVYEDDIPLILLSNHDSDDGDKDGYLKADSLDLSTSIKEEVQRNHFSLIFNEVGSDLAGNSKNAIKNAFDKKLSKTKKKLKNKITIPNGFSSRMVRETDEYTVIKLTKEQVLEEMEANRKSEKYNLAPHKCEKCVKGFNFEDVLQGHMEKHLPKNGSFQCELCSQYCPSAISLRGHMKSHTTKYKCKICHIVRHSRQHILEHYSLEHTDTTPDYKCKECAFSTKKRTVMQRHVKMHVTDEKHTCHRCGRCFKSREILRVHTSRHDAKNRYHCEHCNRTFIYKSVLHKHIRSVHIDKDFYCVECDAMFTSMEALKQHLYKTKKHSDPSQYKYECTQCDEKFLTKSTLGTHQTSVHNAPKSSQCIYCARAYSSTESLRLHVRRTHSGTASKVSVPCPLCDKVFSRKGVLKVHMRVHTGERPYSCDCGTSFTQLASLKAHEAAKHRK